MKLENFANGEVKGAGFTEQAVSIDEKDSSHIYSILFKQMYGRPIDSIVREITSNCFDAHIAAGVDDAVVIKFDKDEGGTYISFSDVGIGLSPERMNNIYLKIGASDKRESNEQLGMFGLGSKSPFSYTDNFFITTVSDGIEYEYLFFEDEKGKPKLTTLIETVTSKRNGTEVKIYMKSESRTDLLKFIDSCKKELIYFDNVFIVDNTYNYSFRNNYTIYEKNTFKYRPDSIYSDTVHLCIGKVAYPIDYTVLGLAVSKYKIPVALKFNIGDLPVSAEREKIRYIDFKNNQGVIVNTKDVIIQKLKEFEKELIDLYEPKIPLYINDIDEYIETRDYPPRAILSLDGGASFDITSLIEPKKLIYEPLKKYLGTIPKNYLFEYELIGEYNGHTIKIYKNSQRVTSRLLRQSFCVRKPSSGQYNRKKSEYLSELAGILKYSKTFYIIDKVPISNLKWIEVAKTLKIPIKSKLYNYEETNRIKQIRLYREVFSDEVISSTYDYENLEIPEDWLKEYRARNKAKARGSREENEFVVYDLALPVSKAKQYTSTEILKKFSGMIIYGFEEDEVYLKGFAQVFSYSPKYRTPNYHINTRYFKTLIYKNPQDDIYLSSFKFNPLAIKLYKISTRNQKYFKYKNCIHVQDFMSNNKVFKKVATAIKMELNSEGIYISDVEKRPDEVRRLLGMYQPKFYDAATKCDEYIDTYGLHNKSGGTDADILKQFTTEVIELAELQNLYDHDMITLNNQVNNFVKGLDLIKYLRIYHTTDFFKAFLSYLLLNNKRLATPWVDKNSLEYQIVVESLEKLNYLKEIYKDYYTYYRGSKVPQSKLDIFKDEYEPIKTIYQTIVEYHGSTN